jgi:hypothetical protein
MMRVVLVAALVLAAAPGQALAQGFYGPFPPQQEDYGPGLTVSGAGLARVKAPPKVTEDSIQQALEAARVDAIARAIADARRRAEGIAAAAGIALGATDAVELDRALPEREPCRRRRGTDELRCVVPAFTSGAATVTFEIVGGASSSDGARELSALGAGSAVVAVARQTSPSIRHALFAARRVATSEAARAARKRVDLAAQGSGLTLGAPLSIVEQLSPYGGTLLGAFAPGRYCGIVRRVTVRHDSETGRPRVVRRRRVRQCYRPRSYEVSIKATYLAQGA